MGLSSAPNTEFGMTVTIFRPLCYCVKYSATELEALALLCSVKHFEYYLFGKHFTILTNYKALVNLFDSAILNNRLWRWRIQLQDYDFNIV